MSARRFLPAAVVAGLLVLVAAATHGRPLSPGSGTGPSATFFDYLGTTLFLLGIASAILVAAVVVSLRGQRGQRQRGRWNLVSSLGMFALFCALVYLLSTHGFQRRLQNAVHPSRQRPTAGQTAHLPPAPKAVRNPHFRWDEAAIVLLILAGVGVYLLRSRAPRPEARRLELRRRLAVSRAVDDSIDDLRRDPDIRRAIIAAYARMERALGGAGIVRRPSEAPFEYLERSLRELDTGASAARSLTGLFERAKFSHHEPAESMRNEAIDALLAVRDDLALT